MTTEPIDVVESRNTREHLIGKGSSDLFSFRVYYVVLATRRLTTWELRAEQTTTTVFDFETRDAVESREVL